MDAGTAEERLVLTGRYRALVFEVVSRADVTLFNLAEHVTPESVRFTSTTDPTVDTWRVANPRLIVRHVGKVGEFVDAEISFEEQDWGWMSRFDGTVHVRRLPDRSSP